MTPAEMAALHAHSFTTPRPWSEAEIAELLAVGVERRQLGLGRGQPAGDDLASRDPVAPAKRSASAQGKASSHMLTDGTPAHSFSTLMTELATIVRNTCRTPNASPDAPTFEVITTASPKQQRAMALVQAITP